MIIAAALLLLAPLRTQAAACAEDTIINFVARNPEGSYIPSVQVDVYKQGLDADNQTKPEGRVGGGTADANLGRANIRFRPADDSGGTYAIRVRTIAKDNASFWFYGFSLGCGQETLIEKTLSGLSLNFYEADGDVLTNATYSVYSQLRDENDMLVEAKNELLFSGNTGSTGRAKVYLPQGSLRSLDASLTDYYVLEVKKSNQQSLIYNLRVMDGQATSVSYRLSLLRLRLRTAADKAAAGAKVEVFKQEVTANNEYKKSDKVGEFTIAETGYGNLELAPGTYALGVKGSDNTYQYFWDIEVGNGARSEYTLQLKGANVPATCSSNVNLILYLKSAGGLAAGGLKFELYEQIFDSGGVKVAGAKVGGGTVDANGRGLLSLKPDIQKTYALKIWEKRADAGDFWYFDALKFVCGTDRTLTKSLPVLKIVWRDSAGELKKNHSFSLWAQQEDIDGKPVLPANGKIADLKTDASGQASAYLAPYNDYRRGQSGVYALTAKDAGGNTVTFYNIAVTEGRDTTYTAQTSGLRGQVEDARGRLQANKEVVLYQVENRELAKVLIRTKTDASGRFSLEYPAGIYALAVKDDFNRESIFWSIAVKPGAPSLKLVMNLTNFSLTAVGGEELPSDPSIKIYTLTGTNASGYFRDKEAGSIRLGTGKSALKSLAAGPYLAVYTGKENKEYGLAFTAVAGQFQNIALQVSSRQHLSAAQSFRLSVPAAPSAGGNSGSLAASVRGRILLQVEDKGQAWYVNPADGRKYYLGRPQDAFNVMRNAGLGISNRDFSALQANPAAWRQLVGKILIKVEDKGRAYYFDPVKLELHYLGRPQDAFNVMRNLGLGITNANLGQISTAQ